MIMSSEEMYEDYLEDIGNWFSILITLVLPETCPILHFCYRISSLLLLYFKISNNFKKHVCD